MIQRRSFLIDSNHQLLTGHRKQYEPSLRLSKRQLYFCFIRAGHDEMRAAERRKEVVKCDLISKIQKRELQSGPVMLFVKEVVGTESEIK